MSNELYIKQIKFIKNIEPIEEGFSLEFRSPVTLLVGDNGCGKSTILDGIRDYLKIQDTSYFKRSHKEAIELEIADNTKVLYYDSHAMNNKYAGAFSGDLEAQIASHKLSSGQSNIVYMHKLGITRAKDALILLDEPCRGMSLKKQSELTYMIVMLSLKNQIVLSTHSDIIMKSALLKEYVSLYSVEHKKYMEYDEFIDTQQYQSPFKQE